MNERPPMPAPTENVQHPEEEIRIVDRPAVAHIALIGIDNGFANPDVRYVSDEQKTAWINATPDALREATAAASEVSWESRTEAYKNDTRSFDEQNKDWNNSFWVAVQETLTDESVDTAVRGERRWAYETLGLDINNHNQDANGLYTQVEAFRKKYVSEKRSDTDINVFINDLAIGCKDTDDNTIIDLQKLEERLQAIEPMLSIFGTHKNAGELVTDFAMAQAMTGQKEEVKKTLAEQLQTQIQRQPSPDEHIRLEALWQKLGGEQTRSEEEDQAAEKPTPEQSKALAKGLLDRELTDDEKAIIDNGGDVRDVMSKARKDVISQIKQLKPITIDEAQSKETPLGKLKDATALLRSTREVDWAYQYHHADLNADDRRNIIAQLKQKAEAMHRLGAETIFRVQSIKVSDDRIVLQPDVMPTLLPEGMTLEGFYNKLDEILNPSPKQTDPQQDTKEGIQNEPLPQINWNEKYRDETGAVYEVVSKGEDLPLALRKDDGLLLLGDDAANILRQCTHITEEDTDSSETTSAEQEKKSASEEIQEITEGIKNMFGPLGQRMDEMDQRIDMARQQINRPLSSSEGNIISHGGSPEELIAIINYKLDQDAAAALEQADKTGERHLTLRGEYDLIHSMQSLNLEISEEQIKRDLEQNRAAFNKAVELKMTPHYVVILKKTQEGRIVPTITMGIFGYPKKADGTELSGDEKTNLMNQVVRARDAAQQAVKEE